MFQYKVNSRFWQSPSNQDFQIKVTALMELTLCVIIALDKIMYFLMGHFFIVIAKYHSTMVAYN
jgi:hypothetical protein